MVDGGRLEDAAERVEGDATVYGEEELPISDVPQRTLVRTAVEVQAAAKKAAALKRALTQLTSIRNVVPGYKALHTRVLGTIRSLTTEDDDISAAGSDEDLESPIATPVKAESLQDPNTPIKEQGEQQVAPSPAVIHANVCVRVCVHISCCNEWFQGCVQHIDS